LRSWARAGSCVAARRGVAVRQGGDESGRWMFHGMLRGLLFGLLLGLPVGVWFASPWTSMAGTVAPGWNFIRGFNPCMMVVLAGSGIGTAVAHASRTFPDTRGLLVRYAIVSAAIGALIAVTVVFTTFYFLPPSGPLTQEIEFAVVLALPCVLGAIGFGLRLGVLAAQWDEQKRQQELRHRLAALDAARAEYEAALERRFGPLDDARRTAIQAWDADRLTEARRKLHDARSVEELDA
jgi:hypothetical protein